MTKKKVGGQPAAKAKKGDKKTPADEEEMQVDAFLSEVESELRDEQMQKLWESYKGWVFGAMGAIILAVAAYQLWQGAEAERLALQADTFARASEQLIAGDVGAAQDSLAVVASEGGAYGALAELQQAAVLLDQGNTADALAIYQSLSTDPTLDPIFTDLATLLWGVHGLETEDPAMLEDALEPLTDPSSPYSYSALELTALLSARRGDMNEARSILEQLAEDTGTPGTIKARAAELAAVFNSPAGGAVRTSPPEVNINAEADAATGSENSADAP